jgi:hypothetical protein
MVKRDKSKTMDKHVSPDTPDVELLDYLGRYLDTADGLDPLTLDGADLAPPTQAGDKKDL